MKRLSAGLLVCLLGMSPLSAQESDLQEERVTAWARLTNWLRPRRNPYRTTVSDIVERGRRSPFTPPPIEDPDHVDESLERDLAGQAARRFMLGVERDVALLKGALGDRQWDEVVSLGRALIEKLEKHRLDEEHQSRRNEILNETRRLMDQAADQLESEGMAALGRQIKEMRQAFKESDGEAVRSLGARIITFESSWTFRHIENSQQATAWRQEAEQLLKRTVIREEFAKLELSIGFRVLAEQGPSTVVLNGKSVREGDSLTEDLKILDITRDAIVYLYKGERISRQLESSR